MAATLPDVVLLAGGRSSRMGQPKGLVAVGGRPWVLSQIDAARAAGADVVLVVGHDAARYAEALPDLAQTPGVTVVENLDPSRGPFSSLQCGLARLAPAAAFVLPVDVPAPGPAVWRSLAEALADADAAVPEHEGRGGHPVLLSADLAARLLGRPATGRLDHELSSARVVRVPVSDPRVRMNLNEPGDWTNL
jgi:molybdenum cofactor cytidylyltransferase